jgi:GNAT superfamily N-acetyltransferase
VPSVLRKCREAESSLILGIINAAAEAYRDVIPPDCWHEPYMSAAELSTEIGAGVEFWGYEEQGVLIGVMGTQAVSDVELIRHAYVHPDWQGHGVGTALISHLRTLSARPRLVGTWAAAHWAIRFYERHGFERLEPQSTRRLLSTYWRISERQLETSVVLAESARESQRQV